MSNSNPPSPSKFMRINRPMFKSSSQIKYRNLNFSNAAKTTQDKQLNSKKKKKNRSQSNINRINQANVAKWSVDHTNSSIDMGFNQIYQSKTADHTQSQNVVPTLPLKNVNRNVNNFFIHKKNAESTTTAKKQYRKPSQHLQIRDDSQGEMQQLNLDGALLNFGGQQIAEEGYMDSAADDEFIQPLTNQQQINNLMSKSNSGISAGKYSRQSNKRTMRPHTTQTQMAHSQQLPPGALQNIYAQGQAQNNNKIHWQGGYLNVQTNNEGQLNQTTDLQLPHIAGADYQAQPPLDAKNLLDNIDLDALNLDNFDSSNLIQQFQDPIMALNTDNDGRNQYGPTSAQYDSYPSQGVDGAFGPNLNTAAQQLYHLCGTSPHEVRDVKKLIIDHDMNNISGLGFDNADANLNTQKAERGISELLRLSLKMKNLSAVSRPIGQNHELGGPGSQGEVNDRYRGGTAATSAGGPNGAGHHSREYRNKLQQKVYQQNLGKLADVKRTLYSRTQQEQMRALPKSKNFIQRNKNGFVKAPAESSATGAASGAKLDRLKRLQQQTSNLINHNQRLEQHKEGQGPDTDENLLQMEEEDFLQQSIDQAVDFSKRQPIDNAQGLQAFMQSQQPQFDPKVLEEFDQDDELSSRTLEQFKNLKNIGGNQSKQRQHLRSSAHKTGGIFPGLSNSRLMNPSGSRSKTRSGGNGSKSRSKSPQVRGGRIIQRVGRQGYPRRDDVEGLLANGGQVGDFNQTPAAESPKRNLVGPGARVKRVRSQTAGAGGAAGRRMCRKESSAAGVGVAGQSLAGATTKAGWAQRRSASNQRGALQGRGGPASSTTTRKFGFGAQKSSVQQLGNFPLNFEDAGVTEQLQKIQSQSFINNIELNESLPEIHSNKALSALDSAIQTDGLPKKTPLKKPEPRSGQGSPAKSAAGASSHVSAPGGDKSQNHGQGAKSSKSLKSSEAKGLSQSRGNSSGTKQEKGASPLLRGADNPPQQARQILKLAMEMNSTQSDMEKAAGDKAQLNQSMYSTKKGLDASGFGSSPHRGIPRAPASLAKPKKDIKSAKKNFGLHQSSTAKSSRRDQSYEKSPACRKLGAEGRSGGILKGVEQRANRTQAQQPQRAGASRSKERTDMTSFQASNRSQQSRSGSQRRGAPMRSQMFGSSVSQADDQGLFPRKDSPLPIRDQDGNIVYASKLRKPKWVLRTEHDRFERHEDPLCSVENSRNARIKMEDPFTRAPHLKTVFSHIRDTDIAKYIVGSSYLSKDQLDLKTRIGIHPAIQSQKLFMDEVLLEAGPEFIEVTEALKDEAIALLLFEFKVFGLKDPYTNLRADPNFIVNPWINDTHIEFRKALEKRPGTGLTRFVFREMLGEQTKEWAMAFDPVNTEKRCARYNRPLPESFLWREEEMEHWRAIMERRADFVHIRADQGEVINEIIDGIMFGYRKHIVEEKERVKVRINAEDLAHVLKELATSPDLVMPELAFDPLPQPEREEFHELYTKHFKYNPERESRDVLQARLALEFLKLRPVMAKYDLIDGSTFHLAADQSDYKQRMRFEQSVLDSEKWDTVVIINDDVYRAKQDRWMRSMLTPFPNWESHEEEGIYEGSVKPMPKTACHQLVQDLIIKNYFTFEKQDLFYYRWYAEYLHRGAVKRRSEYVNFYHFKGVHESMQSRQQEGRYSRIETLHPRHWDFQELQNYVFRPTFTNILEPKNNLLKDKQTFERHFEWFMARFELKDAVLPPEAVDWQRGTDPKDAKSLLFFLHIDFEADRGMAKTLEPPLPEAPEPKLNDLVFRSKHLCPIEHQAAYEIYEVTFDLGKNFDDKEDVHTALESALKKRKRAQYETQLKILRRRKQKVANLLAKHAERREELWNKYMADEKEKPVPRARSVDESTPSWKRRSKQTKESIDIRKAVIASKAPFTAEFPFPTEDQKPKKPYFEDIREYRWSKPFVEPTPVFLKPYEYGYLSVLVRDYQQLHGIKSDEQIVKEEADRVAAVKERLRRLESEKRRQESERLKREKSRRSSQRSGSQLDSRGSQSQTSQLKNLNMNSSEHNKIENASASESEIELMDPKEMAKAAELGESPREIVAPFKIGHHVDDPWESPFLSWIEASLGADKRPSRFITYENPECQMGDSETKRLFEDVSDQFYNRVLRVPESAPFGGKDADQLKANVIGSDLQMHTTRPEDAALAFSPEAPLSQRTHLSQQPVNSQEIAKESPVKLLRPSPVMSQLLGLMGKAERPSSALPTGPQNTQINGSSGSSEKHRDIMLCLEPRLPHYLPLHMKAEDILHMQQCQTLGTGGAADRLRGTLGAMFKKMAAAKPVAAYGAKMNTSEKVLGYVDKQVRKEILEAVRTADLPLLKNFVEQFNKSLTREDQINYQDETRGSGDTILHHALLMDYELKQECISLGDVIQVQPPPREGTGDDTPIPLPVDEVVDIKVIKKALSKEEAASSRIKVEMVRLLVDAGADPSIKNNHGHSAYSIAKNLNESSKVVKILETKMKGQGWSKWF